MVSEHARAPRVNQGALQETLTEMVVGLQLPFSIVEDDIFREFVASLQPKFKAIDRVALQETCMSLHTKRKPEIAKLLHDHPGKLALTVELWSNQETFRFLRISAQYVDLRWKLVRRTLAFRALIEPMDPEAVVDSITAVLEDWKITNKCGSITTESSTPNNLAVNKIREMLKERQVLPPPGDYFHVRCGPTAIKEIVQEAFKTTEQAISKLRGLVHLITNSQGSLKSFQELAANFDLSCHKMPSRDFVAKWDSTYSMISDALHLQLVFEHLHATKPDFLDYPTPVEWLQLKTLKDALEVFHEAVVSLSSTNSPSANRAYLNMKKIERHLSKAEHYENNHSITIICPMANAFQKYWGTIQEFSEMASVLDPRLKFQYLEFSLLKQHGADVAEEKLGSIKNRLYTIFQTYLPSHLAVKAVGEGNPKLAGEQQHHHKGRETNVDDEISEFQKYLAGTTMIQTPYGSRTAELDLYLQEPVFQVAAQDRDAFDVLSWWKAHELRFPNLVLLARNILMIPMSSVSPDLTFSMDERVLNQFHSSLEPACLEASMCVGDWLHADERPST